MSDCVYISNRTIFLQGSINAENIIDVNVGLLSLINQDDSMDKEKKDYQRQPIKLYINSRGGNVDDMWSLIDIMNTSKTPIHTYCCGYAYSAGFIIFISGKKRFMSNHAKLLYHQISATFGGTHQDNKEAFAEEELTQKDILKYVLTKTKIKREKLEEINKRKIDWCVRKDEAILLGIADEEITEL